MMERKKLPISWADFEHIRKHKNFYYVDKTFFVHKLANPDTPPIFLSRPRRFGKSLLLDTFRCLYEGKEALFEGLYIHDKWNWSEDNKYPVIKLDLSESEPRTHERFESAFFSQLDIAEHIPKNLAGGADVRLGKIIRYTYEQTNQKVVLLIDEYDAPLISMKRASQEDYQKVFADMRGVLKCIKANRKYIEFVFMTGILKLDQHDFFSAANIFDDISLDPEYNEICGYTEEELLATFKPELEREDLNPEITLDSLRAWYDGYRWGDTTHLYNPNDILKTFEKNEISDWWSVYGLTTIAIDIIKREKNFDFENYRSNTTKNSLKHGLSLSADNISLNAVLFQTGYLSLRAGNPEIDELYLEPPNLEVKQALARLRLALQSQESIVEDEYDNLLSTLKKCDFDKLQKEINGILGKIVYDEKPEELREHHFSVLMRSMFLACGLPSIETEVHTQNGRADLVIHTKQTNTYYVIEFKVLGIGGNQRGCAMTQLKEKNYAARYEGEGRVFLLGFEFSVGSDKDDPSKPKVELTYLDSEVC